MIVDAHAHACGEFAEPKKLTQFLDRLGVDKGALCPGLKGDYFSQVSFLSAETRLKLSDTSNSNMLLV
jgi:hypothetical protein